MGWLRAHNSNQQLYISETLTSPTQLLQKKKKNQIQSQSSITYQNPLHESSHASECTRGWRGGAI